MRQLFQVTGTIAVWFLFAYGWQSPPVIHQAQYQQDDSDYSPPPSDEDSDDEGMIVSKFQDC